MQESIASQGRGGNRVEVRPKVSRRAFLRVAGGTVGSLFVASTQMSGRTFSTAASAPDSSQVLTAQEEGMVPAQLNPKVKARLESDLDGVQTLYADAVEAGSIHMVSEGAYAEPEPYLRAKKVLAVWLGKRVEDVGLSGQMSHHWMAIEQEAQTFPGGFTVRDPKGYGLGAGVSGRADGVPSIAAAVLVGRDDNIRRESRAWPKDSYVNAMAGYINGLGVARATYLWNGGGATELTLALYGSTVVNALRREISKVGIVDYMSDMTGELLNPSLELMKLKKGADGIVKVDVEPAAVVVELQAMPTSFLTFATGPGTFTTEGTVTKGFDAFAIKGGFSF